MQSLPLRTSACSLLIAACLGAAPAVHAAAAVIANGDIEATLADAGYFATDGEFGLRWRGTEFVNRGTFQSWYRLTTPLLSFAAEEQNSSNPFSAFIGASTSSTATVLGGSIPISFTQSFAVVSSDRITVAVTLTNNSGSAIDHVQWGVGLDPDQDHAAHLDYLTINTIQGTGLDAAVSATGRYSGFTVTLRRTDSFAGIAAAAFIAAGDCCTASATSVALAEAQPPGFMNVDDSAVSLAFDVGTLDPGESASFSYAYDMSIVAVTPPPVPEPATYAMVLAGIGLVGARTLMRRKAA